MHKNMKRILILSNNYSSMMPTKLQNIQSKYCTLLLYSQGSAYSAHLFSTLFLMYLVIYAQITVCLVILVSFGFKTISRKIVKFYIAVLFGSILIDVIWLVLYTSIWWSVGNHYQQPQFLQGYLHFSIFMVILTQFVKLILIYFYLTQVRISEVEVFSIKIQDKTLAFQT